MKEDYELDMNLNPNAVEFRDDLKKVFNQFDGISECGLIDRFCQYLESHSRGTIHYTTITKYINDTAMPGWMLPDLCNFLRNEPYIKNPVVWEFVQKWFGSAREIAKAVNIRIEQELKKIEKEKEKLEQIYDNLK